MLESRNWVRLIHDCPGLLDGEKITIADLDIIFVQCKTRSKRRITFLQFLNALSKLSAKIFPQAASPRIAFTLLLANFLLHNQKLEEAVQANENSPQKSMIASNIFKDKSSNATIVSPKTYGKHAVKSLSTSKTKIKKEINFRSVQHIPLKDSENDDDPIENHPDNICTHVSFLPNKNSAQQLSPKGESNFQNDTQNYKSIAKREQTPFAQNRRVSFALDANSHLKENDELTQTVEQQRNIQQSIQERQPTPFVQKRGQNREKQSSFLFARKPTPFMRKRVSFTSDEIARNGTNTTQQVQANLNFDSPKTAVEEGFKSRIYVQGRKPTPFVRKKTSFLPDKGATPLDNVYYSDPNETHADHYNIHDPNETMFHSGIKNIDKEGLHSTIHVYSSPNAGFDSRLSLVDSEIKSKQMMTMSSKSSPTSKNISVSSLIIYQ